MISILQPDFGALHGALLAVSLTYTIQSYVEWTSCWTVSGIVLTRDCQLFAKTRLHDIARSARFTELVMNLLLCAGRLRLV